MRIVDVSPMQAAPVVTGAMRRIGALTSRLARRHDVDLVTIWFGPEPPSGRGVQVRQLAPGLRQHRVLHRPAWAVLEVARRSWAHAPLTAGAALRVARPRILRDLLARADIAMVEFPWQVVNVRRLGPEVPLVLSAHNVEAEKFASWARAAGVAPERSLWVRWARRAEAAAAPLADLVVTVSPEDREGMIGRYGLDPARVVVVPSGADLESHVPSEAERAQARSELGLPDRPVALFVGAPMAANRLGLRWVRRLAERTDRFTFLVAGGVTAPGRTDGLVAAGWVEDLRPYLRAASVALCPIEYGGGTKIKLLEGMASGLPAIAFAPALRGTDLRPGRELLVVEPDEDALLGALHRLLDDPGLAASLGRAGRRAIETRYSWDDGAEVLDAALVELVSAAARRPVARRAARTPVPGTSPSSGRATSR
jgi:polysaccharide biosynthesis protein PslH